jgi:predicted NBD/HSP70 family sugar kinase
MRKSYPDQSRMAASAQGPSLSGTNLERAGDYNQRVMLQAIRVRGPLTRADLATMTGLTAPTIANITNRLLSSGLILEAGRRQGGRGQPAMRLAVNPDGCFSIGVNIDRDHVTVVALDLHGAVRARATQEIDFPLPEDVASFFQDQLKTILGPKRIPRARLIGVGVAAPDGLGSVNLPNRPKTHAVWSTTDISRLFGDILPLPVFVENDAAAAAIGELQFGHGLTAPSFFYILISGGLGGGLVIEGNYFRGAQGRSGELGFLPLHGAGAQGKTLQEAVSLSALYQRLTAAGHKVSIPEHLLGIGAKGAREIEAWIETAAGLLVEPLLAVNSLVNPNAVFIGGRLPEPYVERLAERINARLAKAGATLPSLAPVRRAAMAADAPAVGAGILPFMARLLPSQAALMKTMSG